MDSAATVFLLLLFSSSLPSALSQTYSTCNPLTQGNCPPNPALSASQKTDFTSGPSSAFKAAGSPQYNSDGALLPVAKGGDSPTLISNSYIMFGKVEVTMKAAPGQGIVSSVVLQSDDLDEIDWEWLGSDGGQVQSNYFGKGQTTTYNRGAFHAEPGNQGTYKTYSIDWTAGQLVWAIDGRTVRTLNPADAAGQYPQTPMQLKMGTWSGGDPANPPGTVQWAGGPTNYAACANSACAMSVKSVTVTDYSTGKSYSYGDSSGTWQSIKADGGAVKPDGSGGPASPVLASSPPPAPVSSVSPSVPAFAGTHRGSADTSSGTNSIVAGGAAAGSGAGAGTGAAVGGPSTLVTAQGGAATATTYPGLPPGWSVGPNGKVIRPANAAPRSHAPSWLLPHALFLGCLLFLSHTL